GDHIVKLIGAVILAVHWFNPGVWVAYKLMTKDMELSCDERALKGFETDVRKEYASALLAVSMKQNHLSRGGLLSFGESGIKSRIKSVLSFKKPALWVTVIAVAVLLVAGGCMLTNPVSGGEEADTAENREGLPALDLAAFEIIEREFYGEWQRTDNPDIVIPITYSNCFLNFENCAIQSVFETDSDYIFVYISGGEQGSFIKPKNEPDTIYSGSYFFSTASEKSSASEDIFHSGVSYKRISKGSTELSEGELSLLGLCKLEFTLGAGFAECFNSIPRNECTAAGRTWVYVPGGSLSLPQQKIFLAGLSEYEVQLGLRYFNKEQSEQHFAYFDLSEAEMMKTEQITPEEMYFTVHFAKSGSKWIYDGITGVYGADDVDVGVEDNAEYVEIEIEDETREIEAPLYESFNGNLLTVEKVKELSQKGSGLDWSDFEGYEGFTCGSGLYIVNYPVYGGEYFVLVGGVPYEKPMYVYLGSNTSEDSVDLLKESADSFFSRNDERAENYITIDISPEDVSEIAYSNNGEKIQTITDNRAAKRMIDAIKGVRFYYYCKMNVFNDDIKRIAVYSDYFTFSDSAGQELAGYGFALYHGRIVSIRDGNIYMAMPLPEEFLYTDNRKPGDITSAEFRDIWNKTFYASQRAYGEPTGDGYERYTFEKEAAKYSGIRGIDWEDSGEKKLVRYSLELPEDWDLTATVAESNGAKIFEMSPPFTNELNIPYEEEFGTDVAYGNQVTLTDITPENSGNIVKVFDVVSGSFHNIYYIIDCGDFLIWIGFPVYDSGADKETMDRIARSVRAE
ncbi:MAG: M56 family metallopeptidase, partial [Ruminiclostridium sp.]